MVFIPDPSGKKPFCSEGGMVKDIETSVNRAQGLFIFIILTADPRISLAVH